MSIEEYIASGILESYVLGGLSISEKQDVELMIASSPKVKEEVLMLQTAMEGYAKTFSVQPNYKLKNNIVAQLDKPQNLFNEKGKERVIYFKYATAASVALMVVFGSLAGLYWSKWQNAEQRLTVIEEQTSLFASQMNKTNYRIGQLEGDLSLVKDTSVLKVVLKGVGDSPSALSVVFWNKKSYEVFIDPSHLPKAPEGMQYQLWAISLEGQPIDAGIFESNNTNGLQKVKSIENAQAYAITLEKVGGSVAPTLTAMVVFGKV